MSSMTVTSHEVCNDWQGDAACAGKWCALFYPPMSREDKGTRRQREARAKAVCIACPVRNDCLEHAIANDERYGIWGGLNGRERRKMTALSAVG